MSQDFPSDQPELAEQATVWSDTLMNEDTEATDSEAFQADLPSLSGEVGKWVVYFQGKRLGIFPTYTDALVRGSEVAGKNPFLAEQISRSPYAAFLARFGF